MTDNNSKHVEEIINHLKRIESDYRIDLTEEMEWLRGLNEYKEYLCTESVGTFEKGKTYKAHPNSPIAKMKNNFVTVEKEPVSEDLDFAIGWYCSNPDNFATWIGGKENDDIPLIIKAIKFGANWQKEQMMAKDIDAHCFGFQGAALFSFRLPADKYLVGSEVKVVVIKED